MTYIVRRQRLEEGDRAVEEVHDLLLRVVVGVALRIQGGVASPMLVPLMLAIMSASRYFKSSYSNNGHSPPKSSHHHHSDLSSTAAYTLKSHPHPRPRGCS